MASCASDTPSSEAIGFSPSTCASFSSTKEFSAKSLNLSMAKRQSGGMFPLLYFPVSNPDASGLQVARPIPCLLYSGMSSDSTLCRSNKLY
uniref:Uncharacterized protein n=1 Tax=Arundo donax TaxID=35708 RepID=A0A0A8YY56_ARUDO